MSKKVNKNVPELRFKEFKEKLSNTIFKKVVLSNQYGPRFNADDYDIDGNIKTIRGTDISLDGEIKYSQVPIAKLDFDFIKNHILKDGDLVMITTADCGLTGVFSKQEFVYIPSAYAVKITLNEMGNPEYFKYFFQTNHAKSEVKSFIRKATVANLPCSDILRIKLYRPTIQEQEKIASFFWAVDTRISQLRRKHELLQTYKRGVMQKIFSQQIRFKCNDGQPFRDWQDKKLNNLFKWVRTNSLSRDALSFESGTIQNIHYGDIHKKFKSQFLLSKEEVPYIVDEFFASNIDLEDFCKIGDLVIADASEDYADIGKAIEIIEVEPNKLVAGLHCFIARPKGAIIVGYSGYLFKSENIRKQIKKIAQGISVLGISKTNLEHLNVPLPCTEEQAKIADFLTAIDKKIEAVAKQIDLTEQFKKGLLQKMFV